MTSPPSGATTTAVGPRRARVELPSQDRALATARRAVRLLLTTWDVEHERVQDVLGIVEALVDDAVRTGDDVVLDLLLDGTDLLVGVTGGPSVLPLPRRAVEPDDAVRGVEHLPGGERRAWALVSV